MPAYDEINSNQIKAIHGAIYERQEEIHNIVGFLSEKARVLSTLSSSTKVITILFGVVAATSGASDKRTTGSDLHSSQNIYTCQE